MSKKLEVNKETWDIVAPQFYGHSSLPQWGPFGVGRDSPELIGKIKGRSFLELGCGSGHSIKYLIEKGAKKVYGMDISEAQLEYTRKLNYAAIADGRVELFNGPMEKKIKIKSIDTVFSVYGFGWTVDPEKTLKNIYSYLKPGGRFIWSWDHTIFTNVQYQNGKFVVVYSYHDDKEIFLKNWKGGKGAYITYRKTATWFQILTNAGFQVAQYLEPKPRTVTKESHNPKRYYSIQKAKLLPVTMIFVCDKA